PEWPTHAARFQAWPPWNSGSSSAANLCKSRWKCRFSAVPVACRRCLQPLSPRGHRISRLIGHKESPMRKLVLCLALLGATSVWMIAQESSDKGKSDTRTVTGCLQKTSHNNRFLLLANDGSSWNRSEERRVGKEWRGRRGGEE